MKKTQWISLFMTIKKNLVSFLAIVMFISLGFVMYCGLSWSTDSCELSYNTLVRDGAVHFFDVTFPLGAREQDVTRLSELEGITAAEGMNRTDAFFVLGDVKKQASIVQLTETIDVPKMVEGVLPKELGEIAVGARWARENGVNIGDLIVFEGKDGESTPALLLANRFEVTALMETPTMSYQTEAVYGISPTNGQPIDCMLFVHKASFDLTATGGYREVLLLGELREGEDVFSDEFSDRLDTLSKKVKKLGTELATERCQELNDVLSMISSQLPEGSEALPTIKDYGCSVATMRHLIDLTATEVSSDITRNTMLIMVSLFILVALLVCFSVIVRVIHENAKEIGTKKALGMSEREIRLEYMLFSLMALLIAAAFGIPAGRFLLEPYMVDTLKASVVFDNHRMVFDLGDVLFICAVEFTLVLGSTALAVHSVNKRNAIALLNGEKESNGKTRFYEKWRLYRRLPILSQIIINNCFNDKRRVFSTIIGVTGSAALIVTAFTYSNVANANIDIQFRDFYHYNYFVCFDSSVTGAEKALEEALTDKELKHSLIYNSAAYLSTPNGELTSLSIFVDMADSYGGLITPVTVDGSKTDGSRGFWLSHALLSSGALESGETASILTANGESRDILPSGFVTCYQPSAQAFCDRESYEKLFDTKVRGNIYLTYFEGDKEELDALLSGTTGYLSVKDCVADMEVTFAQISELTMTMKVVYFSLSVAMAFMVLLNLLIMFVMEKKNELIVLMINGYRSKDAKKYIYSDTIVLTVIGILVGILIGEFVGNSAVSAFENSTLAFQNRFDLTSAAVGAAATAVLTVIMSIVSLRQIPKMKLTELTR